MSKIPFGVWLVGFVFVGCAWEYFWMTGFERLYKRMTPKQKMITGVVLLGVAATALSYGLIKAHYVR